MPKGTRGKNLDKGENMSAFSDKILLATDGSPESARAARMAAGLSSSLGSELHVIHVEPIPNIYAAPESRVMDPELQYKLRERAEMDARERLDEEIEKIEEMGGEVSELHARVGRPDAEIVALAGELGAGLIILGSRGLGAVGRTLMGSVSDSVVRHAHCPVLVVREEDRGAREGGKRERSLGR